MKIKKNIETIFRELHLFRHSHKDRARFEDTLSNGFVNPNRMLYWIEWARANYFYDIGLNIDPDTFVRQYLHVIVHTDVEYYGTMRFFDQYEVLTRMASLGESSMEMHHIIRNQNKDIILFMNIVMVCADHKTGKSKPIPEDLRKLIINWEKLK